MIKQTRDLLARKRYSWFQFTDHGGCPVHEPADASRNDGPLCRWALAETATLTLISVALAFLNRHCYIATLRAVYGDWLIWISILHGSGLMALLWRLGLPSTRRGWACLLLVNGWLVIVAVLHLYDGLYVAVLLGIDLLLRVMVVGLWGVACLGLPYVLVWIRRHRRAPRPAFLFGRFWFSTLILLITAEPMMAFFDREENALSFPERLPDPPADELRIVSIGSSTMFGSPYDPKFGIPQVVAWRLQQMYPRHRVISENLSLPGLSLRQAIGRLQGLHYRPHLLMMYSGHNEFFHDMEEMAARESYFGALDDVLHWSPTFRALNRNLRNNRALQSLKSGVGPGLVRRPMSVPEVFERRRARFRRHLEQLAVFGRTRGIAMLWFIPAASESGFEPNRSVIEPGAPAAEIARLNEFFSRGLDRERKADWSGATEIYRTALARHPQFAEFHFRLGQCLLKLGDPAQAKRHFQDALDNDGHPVRLTSPYRRAIAEVGAAYSIPVVPAGESLRQHTTHGILDRTLFHDNVHPTLRGFYLVGVAGAVVIAKSRLLEPSFGPPNSIPPADFADAIREMKIDRTDVARAHRGIANGLLWLSRLRFDPTCRRDQAQQYLRLAERLEAGAIEPGEEGTEALP